MALDRLQSKPGQFVISAEPGYTVAQSLSSIASNQLPGGYQFGSAFGIAPAGTGTAGGGAFVMKIPPNQTYAASSGTGAMISHDGAGVVFASLSNGGLHNLQPPTFNGQSLKIVNIASGTGSIVTGAVLSGQGAGSTTTAAIPTLTNAVTFGGSTGQNYIKEFVGLTTYGSTATNSTYAVWSCVGAGGVGTTPDPAVSVVQRYIYGQTYAATSGTGAMITHSNLPVVYASCTTGSMCLQPPSYDGQMLTVYNIANVSASLVSTAFSASGNGTLSTTTANIVVMTSSYTIGSSGALSCGRIFQGLSTFGGTVGTNTAVVWTCVGALPNV